MKMANKKYFTLNAEKKVITIDTTITPAQVDKDTVQMYVNAGYIIRYKSEARAKAARKRAKENGFGKKKAETK